MLKAALTISIGCYVAVAFLVFAMHTQMPVTLSLALVRSALWPVWVAGGLQGESTFKNDGE